MKKYIRLIGIIILCFIVSKIDLLKLLSIFADFNIFLFVIAVSLNIPLIFLKSVRWNMLLREQSIQYNLKDSLLVYMSGIYTGNVTPGRLGDFIKAFYLKSDKNISLARSISSVLVDRLFDMYLLMILGIIGTWHLGIFEILSAVSVGLLAIIFLSPFILLKKKWIRNILGLFYNVVVIKKFKGDIHEKFEDFYSGINQLLTPKLFLTICLTCFSYTIFFSQCYLIIIAMDIHIDFVTISLITAISNLIAFLPVSVAGLGTRDAILIYLFSLIGLDPEQAVSYAFLVFIVFFVSNGLMGAVAWWIKPLNILVQKRSES